MLAWMVDEKGIEPHIPVWDKSERKDDSFSRSDFAWNEGRHRHLSRKPASLRELSRETALLSEHRNAEDRTQHSRIGPRCRSADHEDSSISTLMPRAEESRDALCASQANPEARSVTTARPDRRKRRIHACRNGAEPASPGQADAPRPASQDRCLCVTPNPPRTNTKGGQRGEVTRG